MGRKGISGIVDNPDLERRLYELERKAASYVGTTATQASPVGQSNIISISAISGFKFSNFTPTMISMEWNSQPNAQRFEILVSSDGNFSDPAVTRQYFTSGKQNFFNFVKPSEDDADIAYYFKVRAIGLDSAPGPWGPTGNSQSGKLTVNHLDSSPYKLATKKEYWQPAKYILTASKNGDLVIPGVVDLAQFSFDLEDGNAILLTSNVTTICPIFHGMKVGTEYLVQTPNDRGENTFSAFGTNFAALVGDYDTYRAGGLGIGAADLYNRDVFDPPKNGTYIFKLRVFITYDTELSDYSGSATIPGNYRSLYVRGYTFNAVELL